MGKAVKPGNPEINSKSVKPRSKRKRSTVARASVGEFQKRSRKPRLGAYKQSILLISVEILSLCTVAVIAIMVMLGHIANKFSGTSFTSSLLPFAMGVLTLILAAFFFLLGWWKLRKKMRLHSEYLSPLLAFSFALLFTWLITYGQLSMAYGSFRMLVGGKAEAGRMSIAHQIYAAYRRHHSAQLQIMINRAEDYQHAIKDAANAFDVDLNLLQGIAAAESSFLPRDSSDGGRGLFQITQVPKAVVAEVQKKLNAERIVLHNPRHNAYIAAATFKHYLAEMKGDLFLALLAYNIGPANGGLRFIMQQYGATDFTTIQPYLQTLPRDYPIRVLSYSLAFRLWQKEGRLLAYEEGRNAERIQRIGIPGLHTGLSFLP